MQPYISKLSGRSIKGGDFSVTLDRSNVIIGDNFRGKTRILEAAQIALLGYVPSLGKSPRETFNALASGPEMEIRATINSGDGIEYDVRRRFWLEGNSVKTESGVPPFLENFPPVMLEANIYFALGETDRVRYVREHCPQPAGFSDADVVARINRIVNEPGLLPSWTGRVAEERLAEARLQPDQRHDAPFVELLGQAVNEDFKKQKDHADTMERTIRGITGLRAGELTPDQTLSAAQDTRGEAERHLAALAEQKGLKIGAFTAQQAAKQRRVVIAREIEHAGKDKAALVVLENKRRLIDEAIAALPTYREDLEILGTQRDGTRSLQIQHRKEQDQHEQDIRKWEKEMAEIDERTECPYCGATGEGWKGLRLAQLATDIDMAKAASDGLIDTRKADDELLVAIDARIKAARELTARESDLAREKSKVTLECATLNTRLARIETLAQELDALPETDLLLEKAVDEIQTKINQANAFKAEVDRSIEHAQGRRQELKRLAEAEQQRDIARARQELARVAGTELKAIKAEMAAAAFRPLLEAANKFFPDILLSPLAYDLAKGEIGSRRDGLWVSHRTFTGVEKALTYAAIQAALSMQAPLRIMLIDELGRFTAANATKLADCIRAALRGELIGQFIGVDPERQHPYVESVVTDSAFKIIEVR